MKYEFRELEEKMVQALIELSKMWQTENCSYGMIVNTEEGLKQPLCVAVDNDEIVGYIFGHYHVVESKT